MLYITNRDKPGLVGALGSILGDASINIATFQLGRDEEGGNAIALIEIDSSPAPDLLGKLIEVENILQAIPMRF